MADEFSWTISGQGPWARTWRGKDAVRRGLMAPLFDQFADTYRNRALRMVAEGDMVVVECRGSGATKSGARYDNHYTYWIELHNGRMVSLTEFMDTALAERVLVPPENAWAPNCTLASWPHALAAPCMPSAGTTHRD